MDWKTINSLIPDVVNDVRKEYILNNTIIKDDIFRILEKHCVVVYYPIEDETKNRGFHIQRFLNGELKDFVYINTAKTIDEQIFAAAHELGHVWKVAVKVWDRLETDEELTEEIEEQIVGRFAAELLMPENEFKLTFKAHLDTLGFAPLHIRVEELIRVMVMQMSDFMVPYEAIRRRMLELSIISEEIGAVLNEDKFPEIHSIVSAYLKDLNTTLEEKSMKKTIPGLRDLIVKAETSGTVSEFVLSKIKEDFSIEGVNATEQIITLSVEGE
ncbi:MAG: ImmA/IrrE family metallo-endopeptidase [Eubacterium sp.]|nr:ImmA/IrrE family metallo-endopeptidase [Eubacterium sp.]